MQFNILSGILKERKKKTFNKRFNELQIKFFEINNNKKSFQEQKEGSALLFGRKL